MTTHPIDNHNQHIFRMLTISQEALNIVRMVNKCILFVQFLRHLEQSLVSLISSLTDIDDLVVLNVNLLQGIEKLGLIFVSSWSSNVNLSHSTATKSLNIFVVKIKEDARKFTVFQFLCEFFP